MDVQGSLRMNRRQENQPLKQELIQVKRKVRMEQSRLKLLLMIVAKFQILRLLVSLKQVV
ncbi:hypothetical protein D3C77_424920 [compost metagenome]